MNVRDTQPQPIWFALATLLLLGLSVGCGDDGSQSEGSTATSSPTSGASTAGSTTGSTNNATTPTETSTTTETSATTGTSAATSTQPTACDEDEACSVGEICVEMQCRFGCREDSDCAQNELCLQETCIAQGEGCRDDEDCASGDYCDLNTTRCREDDGCRSDLGEPNDNLAEATPLDPERGQLEGRFVCAGDNDYFALEVELGQTINVQLTHVHSDGDLTLQLLDDRGQPIVRRDTADDTETISYRAQYTGLFYLRVFGAEMTTSNRYDLNVTLSTDDPTARGCEDSFEPNETSSQVEVIQSRSYDLTLCDSGDQDWFAVNLPPAANIDLRTNSTSTNLVLTFYDRDAATILGRSARDERQQTLETIETALSGIYFIQVTSTSVPAEGLDYTLTVSINGAVIDTSCDDRFEPNEAPQGATPLEQGRYSELTLCDTDQDYFKIDLTAQDRLTVSAIFEHELANIDMEAFDELGTRLTGSTSTTNNEEITLDAPTSGRYTIRLHHLDGLTANYELLVHLSEGADAPECTDPYDGNHTIMTAAQLPTDGDVEGRVCLNTPDLYALENAAPGSYLTLELDVDISFGVVNVDLLPPFCVAACEPIITFAANEPQNILLEEAGTYHLRVALERGETTSYRLNTELLPPPSCDQDRLEPNNSVDNAQPISNDEEDALVACIDDEDWFLIAVEPNTRLNFSLSLLQPLGEVGLELFEPDGTTLLWSRSTTFADIALSEVIIEGGNYLARVTLREGFNTRYNLSVTQEDLSACFDSFEGNNTYMAASAIEAGTYDALTLCDTLDEDDFFAIPLRLNDVLTVETLFSHADGDLDLAIMNTNGTSSLRRASSSSDNEFLRYTIPRTGTYFIRAYHFGGGDGVAPYTLNVEVDPFEPPACTEDANESDDTVADANIIVPGDYAGTACFDNSDWFAITVEPGRYLTSTLTFTHSDGDLSLEYIDADGETILASSETSNDDEILSWGFDEETTAYIRVYPEGSAVNSYELNVAFTDEPAITECRDRLEPNNSSETAYLVEPGSYPDLSICASSDYYDWYIVELEAGQQLDAEILFSHAVNNLDLVAYDTDRSTRLVSSFSTNDREAVTIAAPRSGLYPLRIRGNGSNPSSYDLNISVSPYTPPECPEDPGEEDDSAIFATFIDPGTYTGQLCFADPDWFSFTADAGQRATVNLSFNNLMGNLNFRILDIDGTTELGRATSSYSSSETLVRTLQNSGVYYVEIFGVGAAQNSYELDLTIRDP